MVLNTIILYFLFYIYSPVNGLYVSYQRLEDLKVTRTSSGDHWFADSQSKCERFINAIFEPNELRCKCPHEFPHFFGENGEWYGCYADNQIDDSCLFTTETGHILNIHHSDQCGYIPTNHLLHHQNSLEEGMECRLEENDIPLLIHNSQEWELPPVAPDENNNEGGNQVLGHTESVQSYLESLVDGQICNRYENRLLISKYEWIIGRLLRVRLKCRKPNDNRIIKGCFIGKALGASRFLIKKPENPIPKPITTTTTPLTTTTTTIPTTTTPTTTITTTTTTTTPTTTMATSTTTTTTPKTTTTIPMTIPTTTSTITLSIKNLAKSSSVATPTKAKPVVTTTTPKTTTVNPWFEVQHSKRTKQEQDLAVKVALGIGLATLAIILFIIFIVICRKCKNDRAQRRERRNTQVGEEVDNRSERSNKYVISSVKSTVPVIQNEELYMELDLNSVEPEQYADLQTLRRPNESRKNPPIPDFNSESGGTLRRPSEDSVITQTSNFGERYRSTIRRPSEDSVNTQTSNFGERYRSTVRRPSSESILSQLGSDYKNGTFPRLSEGRTIPGIPDFGIPKYGRGTMRRPSAESLPPIPGSENKNMTFPRLSEGRMPIPDFSEMYRPSTMRRPSSESIPPIPRAESSNTLASVSEELNSSPITDCDKMKPETDQCDDEAIYNEIPIYFETYADPTEVTK